MKKTSWHVNAENGILWYEILRSEDYNQFHIFGMDLKAGYQFTFCFLLFFVIILWRLHLWDGLLKYGARSSIARALKIGDALLD